MPQYFAEYGLDLPLADDWAGFAASDAPAMLGVCPLHAGFAWPAARLAVVTEAELYAGRGAAHAPRRRPPQQRRRDAARPVRAQRRRPGGARAARHRPLPGPGHARPRRRRDRVPAARSTPTTTSSTCRCRSLHVIGRYSGASPEAAPLHKLGSGQWDKAKTQRREAGARHRGGAAQPLRAARGAPGPRVRLQRRTTTKRFADGFGFEETPDQQARDRGGDRRPQVAASRWTGWSAATSASARPRSRCARPSSRWPTASRSRCWCRRRCSPSSTSRPSPTASPTGRCSIAELSRFRSARKRRPRSRAWPTAASTSSSAPTS